MSSHTKTPFRAIIVGGGPSGLSLGHCFDAVGVDYIILERRKEIVEPTGAGLGCWPQSVRILSQLGLLDHAKAISSPMKMSYQNYPDGSEISKLPMYDYIEERHGYPFMLFERMAFVQMLFETLPSQSKVRTGQHIIGIDQDDTGVSVKLNDGTIEQGDIVIGADGVRSGVREIMWNHNNHHISTKKTETTLSSRYKCLFGMSPLPANETSGDMIETHNRNYSIQLLNQPQRVMWFLFVRLDQQTPSATHYTDEDAELLAAQYMDAPITQNTCFSDLWETRVRAKLGNLEEGVQELWYGGRIVLLGDAAHKMTPNLAFGYNNALESAVSLTNHLHGLLQQLPSPPTASLTRVFEAYQAQRFARAKFCYNLTGFYTRFAAWENAIMKWGTIIAPKVSPETFVVDQVARWVKGGLKLESVDLPEREKGSVLFEDEVGQGEAGGNMTLWLGASLVILGLGAWWFGMPRFGIF